MIKPNIYLGLILSATLLSCAASDDDLREDVIKEVNNKDIMIDVTDAHVTLSGFVFNLSDTIGIEDRILKVDGIKSVENNISYFDENMTEEE